MFLVVAVAVDIVVWHVAGRRRALMRLCRWRPSCVPPFPDQARDGERLAKVFRERPQEGRVTPRYQGRITGIAPAIDLLPDNHNHAIERKYFQHLPDRSQIVYLKGGRAIAVAGGEQRAAQLAIGGGLPSKS